MDFTLLKSPRDILGAFQSIATAHKSKRVEMSWEAFNRLYNAARLFHGMTGLPPRAPAALPPGFTFLGVEIVLDDSVSEPTFYRDLHLKTGLDIFFNQLKALNK